MSRPAARLMKKLISGYAYELYITSTAIHFFFLVSLSLSQSLGCTLYALAYSHSPFETAQTTEQGGSIAMSVLNGVYKHPVNAGSIYSEGLRGLIDFMLKVDPSERPNIHQVRHVV